MSLVIRDAKPKDLEQIISIAMGQAKKLLGRLRPSRDRIKTQVRNAISSPACYTRVTEIRETGEIVAVLMTLVQDHFWAERKSCTVTLWWSMSVGAGFRLLKDFVSWLSQRRIIRVAGFIDSHDTGDRITKLYELAGFEKEGSCWVIYN